MGYDAARNALSDYRSAQQGGFIGDMRPKWFPSQFGGVKAMLAAFDSSDENGLVASEYATGTTSDRIPAHMRLDYVCALRRDVRRQYASGDDGIYTDVTPFRHGAMSSHGARLFADAMDDVLTKGGRA